MFEGKRGKNGRFFAGARVRPKGSVPDEVRVRQIQADRVDSQYRCSSGDRVTVQPYHLVSRQEYGELQTTGMSFPELREMDFNGKSRDFRLGDQNGYGLTS